MRFNSQTDVNLFVHFSKELVNTIMDVQIVIFKLNITESKKNLYGESTRKTWYTGVQIPCIIDINTNNIVKDGQPLNVMQDLEFSVLLQECKIRNIYPELGDVVAFAGAYFEIDQVNDIQYIGGQQLHNYSFTCHAHLTRDISTQLDQPVV